MNHGQSKYILFQIKEWAQKKLNQTAINPHKVQQKWLAGLNFVLLATLAEPNRTKKIDNFLIKELACLCFQTILNVVIFSPKKMLCSILLST